MFFKITVVKPSLKNKLLIVFFFFLNAHVNIVSQEDLASEKQEKARDEKKMEEDSEEKLKPGLEKKTEQIKKQEDAISTSLNGFAGVNWGTQYKDVKERFRVLQNSQDVADSINILADSPGESLLIERGGLRYKFLFYSKKEPKINESSNILRQKNNENKKMELQKMARFFFVSSEIPFVPSETLYEKIKGKYGKHTSTAASKERGAYIWDVDSGVVVQWVESYREQPYSRSIYYVSKEIRAEIMRDLEVYQNYKELKIIEKLIP